MPLALLCMEETTTLLRLRKVQELVPLTMLISLTQRRTLPLASPWNAILASMVRPPTFSGEWTVIVA